MQENTKNKSFKKVALLTSPNNVNFIKWFNILILTLKGTDNARNK